jgi:hypothetical protein
MTNQTDFNKWEQHAKTCDIEALQYIIKDCARARDAMRTHNTEREAYYADQCFTYQDELRRRLKNVGGY